MGFIFVCMVILAVISIIGAVIAAVECNDAKGGALGLVFCMLLGLAASTLSDADDARVIAEQRYANAQQNYETVLKQYNSSVKQNRDLVLDVKTLETSLEAQAIKVAKAHVAIQEARREGELQKVQCMKLQAEAQADLEVAEGKLQRIQGLIGETK